MRALWIALLIALLPLRGWVGDAMAVSMIATPASAAAASPAGADCPHAAASAGHHAEPAPDTGALIATDTADGHQDHTSPGAHLLCDVCNVPALSTGSQPDPDAHVTHGLRIERKQAFASLAPRHLVKPPIV